MIQIRGQRHFAEPVDVLSTKLADLAFVVSAIPDVRQIKSLTADAAEIVVRPSLAFVQADLNLSIEKIIRAGSLSDGGAAWLFRSKAIGSTSRVRAEIALEPSPGGSTVHWTATVEELGGLLKLIPAGLIQAAAERIVGDILSGIESRLGGSAGNC